MKKCGQAPLGMGATLNIEPCMEGEHAFQHPELACEFLRLIAHHPETHTGLCAVLLETRGAGEAWPAPAPAPRTTADVAEKISGK